MGGCGARRLVRDLLEYSLVVVDPFLYSDLIFGIVKFIGYVCIQTWFAKLKVESYVYYCIFECMSCLYHVRPPSRGTIGVVSIGTWVEKGSPN